MSVKLHKISGFLPALQIPPIFQNDCLYELPAHGDHVSIESVMVLTCFYSQYQIILNFCVHFQYLNNAEQYDAKKQEEVSKLEQTILTKLKVLLKIKFNFIIN